MQTIDVMADPYFKQFVRSRAYSESSIRIHKNGVEPYCKFLGKNPKMIIDEAIEDEDNRLRMNHRRIKRYLLDFVEYQTNKNYAHQTIKNHVNSVKTFYHEYDVQTPRIKLPSSNDNPALYRIPSREHVAEAIKHASIRNKAIVLLMSSSGLGSAELRSLKYKQFIDAIKSELSGLTGEELLDVKKIRARIKDKEVIGQWNVVRQKTKMPYVTFSTPESIRAILDYLLECQMNNKPIKRMDEYLFGVNGKAMLGNTLDQIFQALNDRCGFGKNGYQRFFRSHNMRKFFTNSLFNAEMDYYRVRWLLGHKIDDTPSSYFKFDIEAMKNEYKKRMGLLTIQKTKVKTVESTEYKHLISKIMEKQNDINRLEKRLDDSDAKRDEELQLIYGLLSNKEFLTDFTKKARVL